MSATLQITLGFVFQDNNVEVKRLLASLSEINLDQLDEIIAVDNSNSQSVEIDIYKNFGNVKLRIVKNKMLMPLPYNRNQIFRMSHSDIVIFLDSDVEFIQKNFIDVVLGNFSNFNVDIMSVTLHALIVFFLQIPSYSTFPA